MAKKRTFAAKLAHEIGTEGKQICPNCDIEIKRVKVLRNKKRGANNWSPAVTFQNICKCNEGDIFSVKTSMQ